MILTDCSLTRRTILIKIHFHHFSIDYILLVAGRNHICSRILCIQLFHCLILIQKHRVRVFVETILGLWMGLIVETLIRILSLNVRIICRVIHSQQSMQDVGLTSLQIV